MTSVIDAKDRFHKKPTLKAHYWRHPCFEKAEKNGKKHFILIELRSDEACPDCGKHPPSI